MSGMPGLVIFDCDGVLVDSERLSHQVLIDLLAEQGVTLAFDEAVGVFLGNSMPRMFGNVDRLLGGRRPGDFDAQFERRCRAAFADGLSAVEGVLAVLDGLGGQGVPYCVASNGPHSKMDFTLHHTALMSRLAGRIFSADDVEHGKPAPDLFLFAAERLGVAPARCVVVEDSPAGITAARAAGMTALGFCAMTPPERLLAAGAHATFRHMRELPALLASSPASAILLQAADRAAPSVD